VAAAAAFTTISYLARQASEARRQTEFIVGEALPSASIVDTPAGERNSGSFNRIFITNWNRNPIAITRIEHDRDTAADSLVLEPAAPCFVIHLDNERLSKHPLPIAGWVNRTEPPPVQGVDILSLFPASKLVREGNVELRRYAGYNIYITIAGERHTNVVLHVSRPDALVSIGSFDR